MLNLKKDIIRQLNVILKISLKQKFKNEIIDRINSFIILKYGDKTYLELIDLKNEISINNNEITELKIPFFNSYQEELLNFFNPNWYTDNQNFKRTTNEMNAIIQYYTKDAISNVLKTIPCSFTQFVLNHNIFQDKIAFYIKNSSRNFEKSKLFFLENDKEKIIKRIEKDYEFCVSPYLESINDNNYKYIIDIILNKKKFDDSILDRKKKFELFIIFDYLFFTLLLKELKG